MLALENLSVVALLPICLALSCEVADDIAIDDWEVASASLTIEKTSSVTEPVLLVASGGWNSCRFGGPDRQYISAQFENLRNDLSTRFPNKRFYGMSSCSNFSPPAGRKRLLGGRTQGEIDFSYSGEQVVRTIPTNNWHKRIANRARAVGISPGYGKVILMGHSYGGWVVMEEAAKLMNSGLDISLYGIEPVSARGCSVQDYVGNKPPRLARRRAKAGKWTLRDPNRPRRAYVAGCRQSPADTANDQISAATNGKWINLHLPTSQPRGSMHSGPANYAHNLPVPMNGDSDQAHHRFGFDANVWREICCKTARSLDPSADLSKTCTAISVDGNGKLTSRKRYYQTCN